MSNEKTPTAFDVLKEQLQLHGCLESEEIDSLYEEGKLDGHISAILKFAHIKCNEKKQSSPTPLSAEDILDSKQTVSDRKYNNWYHQHECLEAMEEYASQQTAQLRQQVEELTKQNEAFDRFKEKCEGIDPIRILEVTQKHSSFELIIEHLSHVTEIVKLKESNEKMERAIGNALANNEQYGSLTHQVEKELKQSLNNE